MAGPDKAPTPSAWTPVPNFTPLPPVPTAAPDAAIGLDALATRLAHDLRCLGLPAKDWMAPPQSWQPAPDAPAAEVLDVAIIGAGQAGLAVALALRHLGIAATLFDRAPDGAEGPWVTTARMETLRSPKELTGPALGLAALTFRAWFEAQFGAAAWAVLDKIPRAMWMDYLRWFRSVNRLAVHNGCDLLAVQPRADATVDLELRDAAGTRTVRARRVVLATGRDGLGGAAVPGFVQGLPRGLPAPDGSGHGLWAHSADEGDFSGLAGKRVLVIGAGSSAMDVAGTALEAGARSVDLLIRRSDLPRINKGKGAGNPGLVHGHPELPDALRWALRHYINVSQVPPPHGSTLRVSRHPHAHFHFGCPVRAVRRDGAQLLVDTPKGRFRGDFLFVATGFVIDWAQRPELAAIAPHVRTWRSRYTPPAGDEDAELSDSPDLGPLFEFQPRQSAGAGACPGLERVHCFNYPAALSHGTVSGDIPAISDGALRLARGLAAAFYREDITLHLARMQAWDDPELLGDEWQPADTAAVLAQRAAEDAAATLKPITQPTT